jgi:hypothetical protein
MRRQLLMRYFLFALILAAVPAAHAAGDPALLDQGFRQMYNLQFDQAHQTFAQYQQLHGDDPLGPVSDAAAWLFGEFDRLHILQSELFIDDDTFNHRAKQHADPMVKQKFDAALAKSQQLSDRILAQSPHDQNATFAVVLRMGLHADYLAMIEKRSLAALSEMKVGRAMAESLVANDPKYADAYLAIGAENYLLSLKAAPIRWILHIGGAQTDAQVGIQKLKLTAANGRYLRPYARLLLAVAALRAKDRAGAKELLTGLVREFPANRLYVEELARLK